MERIFDAHAHTYPKNLAEKATRRLGEFYKFRVMHEGTVEDLCRTSAEAGVSGFMILGVATGAHHVRKINETISAEIHAARKNGFLAYGCAAIHQDTEDFAAELDHALKLGLTGVKLHPDIQFVAIDDERLLPLYALASERKMHVCFHMGDDRPEYRFSEPHRLARVLDMFEDLTVIATHLGGWRAWDEAKTYLAGRKNVVFDLSSVLWAMEPETAEALIRSFGVENVMFGTDYPVISAKDYISLFDRLRFTERERRAILWDNASRLLGFEG